MTYGYCENADHIAQALRESIEWHDTLNHFKNDRERKAFEAGFLKAAGEQRSLFKLHANLTLKD
jgi:hypothetical protein